MCLVHLPLGYILEVFNVFQFRRWNGLVLHVGGPTCVVINFSAGKNQSSELGNIAGAQVSKLPLVPSDCCTKSITLAFRYHLASIKTFRQPMCWAQLKLNSVKMIVLLSKLQRGSHLGIFLSSNPSKPNLWERVVNRYCTLQHWCYSIFPLTVDVIKWFLKDIRMRWQWM